MGKPKKDDEQDQAAAPEGVETNEDGTVVRQPGDAGVPMLPGSPDEPVGPEDALGEGPTRGDYRDRVDPLAHEGDKPQAPNAEDIGDAPGLKGGVDTVPDPEPRDAGEEQVFLKDEPEG